MSRRSPGAWRAPPRWTTCAYVGRRVPTAAEVDDVIQEILVRIHKGLDSLHDGERFGGCNVQCTYSPTGNACNG